MSVITAITAQSTRGVIGSTVLPADLVTAQIEAIAGDSTVDAVKVGMLGTAAIVEAVAAAIEELELPSVVLDPVIAASSGARLLDDDGVQAMRLRLMPLCRVMTPNIPEAEALSGCRIGSAPDIRKAAERLVDMGAESVIVTGGHAPGADVVDLFFDGSQFVELHGRRIAARAHGTGCTYASAVAAGLAHGEPVKEAAARAQRYVAGALTHALAIGKGARVLNHFWQRRGPG
jgi:hydroxymethylpyrimidine/phosphomethylpyrimidine kinase